MNKAYSEIVFVNGTSPDLDATNMNAISSGLNTVDNRVIALDTQVSANTSEITSLSNSTSAIASSLSTFSAATTSEIATINSNVSSLSASVSSATSEIATHTSEITSLSTATSELSSEVTYIGSEVAVNTSDIADLKNKPSSALVLTSASPLATSSASNILGIECEGKSTQSGTPTPTNPIAIVDASGVVVAHTINLTDKQTTGSNLALPKPLPIGTYTISFETDMTSNSFRLSNSTDTSKDSISSGSRVSLGNNRYAITLTTTFESNYYSTNANGGTYVKNIMIEQGTTASDYVAYASNSIKIDGNIFTTSVAEIGKAWNYSANSNRAIIEIDVKPATTYTVDFTSVIDSNVSNVMVVQKVGRVNQLISGKTTSMSIGTSANVTTDATCEVLCLQIETTSTCTSNDVSAFRVAKVKEQNLILDITLRSIGTVADTLVVKADGSGVLTQRVYVFTPNASNCVDDSPLSGSDCKRLAFKLDHLLATNVAISGLSNMYTNVDTASYSSLTLGQMSLRQGSVSNSYVRLTFPNSCTTKAECLAYLTNCKVYYLLPTPIVTNLTSTQVASILALKTYNGTTIVDSEIVKDVTYSADVKGYVDSKCDYSYADTIIGKWADGKDLHRLVYRGNTPSTSGSAIISALNGNNCSLKNLYGFIDWTTDTKVPINYYATSSNYATTYISANGIVMSMGSALVSKPCEIIVEYTLNEESAIATLSEVSE